MNPAIGVRKFTMYGAMCSALLLAAAFTALPVTVARADEPNTASCDNAPKPGAEYLSDQCNWAGLEAATDPARQQHQTTPYQDEGSRPGM